jgi:hypothetical protein
VKPSYILKVIYPIAAVMAKIHSPAVVMRALRSMVLAVCDSWKGYISIYLHASKAWDIVTSEEKKPED